MLALRYERFGEPAEVVAASEVPTPQPGAGEVRLRMRRSAIHNHDLATIRGVYGYKPTLPAIGGSEAIGEVDAVGEGAEFIPIGSRVATMGRATWAEYILAQATAVVPMPDAISDDVGAQLLAMPLSAVVLFDALATERDMWIAQNAAGGAVGRILMHLAQSNDINIINIVRSAAAAEELKAHGARHVVVTSEDGEWRKEIRDLTGGKGVKRIVDSVAGPGTLELQQVLAHNGEIIIFGGLSGAAIKLDPSLMISLECTVRGFWMTSWMEHATLEQRVQAMQRVFALALQDKVAFPVAGVYPLRDATSALAAAETPGRGGKVLFST